MKSTGKKREKKSASETHVAWQKNQLLFIEKTP